MCRDPGLLGRQDNRISRKNRDVNRLRRDAWSRRLFRRKLYRMAWRDRIINRMLGMRIVRWNRKINRMLRSNWNFNRMSRIHRLLNGMGRCARGSARRWWLIRRQHDRMARLYWDIDWMLRAGINRRQINRMFGRRRHRNYRMGGKNWNVNRVLRFVRAFRRHDWNVDRRHRNSVWGQFYRMGRHSRRFTALRRDDFLTNFCHC